VFESELEADERLYVTVRNSDSEIRHVMVSILVGNLNFDKAPELASERLSLCLHNIKCSCSSRAHDWALKGQDHCYTRKPLCGP